MIPSRFGLPPGPPRKMPCPEPVSGDLFSAVRAAVKEGVWGLWIFPDYSPSLWKFLVLAEGGRHHCLTAESAADLLWDYAVLWAAANRPHDSA